MEPVVTLDGAQKLPDAGLERKSASSGAPGQPQPVLPLDGRSVVCTAIDRDTVLIAGIGDSFAPHLQAILNESAKDTVPCTVLSLSGKTKGGTGQVPFVAVLFLQSIAVPKLERVTIRSKGHSHPYSVKYGPVAFEEFLGLVAAAAAQTETGVVDLLIDTFFSGKADIKNQQVAAKLLGQVARRDGFIEMLGRFDEGDFYMQGWSKDLPAGSNRVFLFDGSLKVADLSCCLFERKDTGGKASGFAGILDLNDGLPSAPVRSLFFRGRSGWNKVDVHERGTVSGARALPGLIRALLPRLNAAGGSRAKLEASTHRFDGRETVSELDVPVRVGLDFCAAADPDGVVLSGWLLNPEDHVEAVYLRSGSASSRLDNAWTPQKRPDVSEAFEDLSPFLEGASGTHRHGFLVFVPGMVGSQGEIPYLEVVLKDGRSAYAPLALGRTTLRSALRRLVAGLDPAIASETDIIDRQFLPLLSGVEAARPSIEKTIDIGTVPETATRTIVVGLDDAIEKVRTLIPVLALDPFLRGTAVVLSARSSDLAGQLQEIKRLAAFYNLPVRAVAGGNVEDKLDALQIGLEAVHSETVICLSSSVIPLAPGWLEPLVSKFESQESRCLVTPTILYEDDTIRWAGTWIDKDAGDLVVKQHYVGYPRRTLMGAESCEVVAATFDCCVLPKDALSEAGGFARHYLGTDEKGMDATLKLRAAGLKSYWVPQVEMVHPEDGHGSERLWHKLVNQHDKKQFERLWQPALADLREGAS
ncbi:hypothetical protein [uncultured Roseibium sp.]|uniref:glycosyltransferase family 2 protein n=1 Tax=uncultured Roseibium sp. TaxID=1936171 RepID=UPI0026363C0A|nr:hypothetical protein [uncultured Roseibium sp.]